MHLNRVVFLIVAISYKCDVFYVGPNWRYTGPAMAIYLPGYHNQPWLINARIKAIYAALWLNIVFGEISPIYMCNRAQLLNNSIRSRLKCSLKTGTAWV
jgi:hypothetical protein